MLTIDARFEENITSVYAVFQGVKSSQQLLTLTTLCIDKVRCSAQKSSNYSAPSSVSLCKRESNMKYFTNSIFSVW